MSFDTEWLDLREPADHAARNADLLQQFADALPAKPHIIDLGSGTGSTLRAVAPIIPDAKWLLTDNDPVLLAEAKRRAPGAQIEQVDLAKNLAQPLAHNADAITASALIDLVSAAWLDDLVRLAEGRALYIALSVDGDDDWQPAHPDDALIAQAFKSHQRRDKGFGPALGGEAASYLAAALHKAGYHVRLAPSAWRLTPGPLTSALAGGIANASSESGVAKATADAWCEARRPASAQIGHIDLLAQR